MKTFTKSEIDAQRNEFANSGYSLRAARLEGRNIDFFVMPVSVFDGVPNGVFRMTGEPDAGYLIGVSQFVPEIIKPHFAMSGYDEFMQYRLANPNRTLCSEQNMMQILNGDSFMKSRYRSEKLRLYNRIIVDAFGNLEKWDFTPADYTGYQKAAEFLRNGHL